jgi:hypothetical protein
MKGILFILLFGSALLVSSCTQDISIIEVDSDLLEKEQAEQFSLGLYQILYGGDLDMMYPYFSDQVWDMEAGRYDSKDSSYNQERYIQLMGQMGDDTTFYSDRVDIDGVAYTFVANTPEEIYFRYFADSDESMEEVWGNMGYQYNENDFFVSPHDVRLNKQRDPFFVVRVILDEWKLVGYV